MFVASERHAKISQHVRLLDVRLRIRICDNTRSIEVTACRGISDSSHEAVQRQDLSVARRRGAKSELKWGMW
eukprot:6459367-Amphidinium_carterae.1